MFTEHDHYHMAKALQLAALGMYTTAPNPRVGCVITQGAEQISQGWHRQAGQAHAEIIALKEARDKQLAGSTIYVTLEPCNHHGKTPPCVDAIINAGAARVVIAMSDPNPLVNGQGIARLRDAGITVDIGLMQAEAEALNPGFISRISRQRPHVRVKLAMSLDGRTALADGQSQWITGPDARLDVQRWRARSSAIMAGINTVLQDDPSLNLRLETLAAAGDLAPGISDAIKQPLRVILDSQFQIPLNAKLLDLPGDILIITTSDNANKRIALSDEHLGVVQLPADDNGRPRLNDIMSVLAAGEINELLVEGGPVLAGALLQAQLVDELVVYMAPSILGDSAAGLFKLPALASLQDKVLLSISDVRKIGNDIRILARPEYS